MCTILILTPFLVVLRDICENMHVHRWTLITKHNILANGMQVLLVTVVLLCILIGLAEVSQQSGSVLTEHSSLRLFY